MRAFVVALVAIISLALAAPTRAQDAPSNAELFRMFKDQQKVISELRAELKQSREEAKQARQAADRTDRKLAARPAPAADPGPVATRTPRGAAELAYAARPEPNSLSLSATALFMKAGIGDTSFVINSPVSTTFPNGSRENNDADYRTGFRIGAGYQDGMTNRKWMVNYTHLSESTTKNISGNFLWATTGRADFASNFENYTGTASSSTDIKYDRVDLLASEPLKLFDSRLAFLYGFEYARIRVNENNAYAITGGTSGTVTSNSSFSGFGPQAGFSFDYMPFRGGSMPGTLSLNSVATMSLLYGSADNSGNNVLAGASILNVSDASSKRVVAALHMRSGVGYSFPVGNFTGMIKAGYEYNSYIGAVTRTIYPDDVADSQSFGKRDNFDLSGPYASFTLKAPLP